MLKFKGFKAFTMIEMLVVIAIIIIMVSFIMPVIGTARQSARNVLCKNNLKQLHVAFSSYLKEHSGVPGVYPVATNGIWEGSVFVPYDPPHYELEWHGWITWANYMTDGKRVESAAPPASETFPWWGVDGLAVIRRSPFFAQTGGALGIYLCPEFALKSVSGDRSPTGTKFDEANPRVRSYVMNLSMRAFYDNWNQFNSASQRLLFTEPHTRASDKVDGQTVCNYGFLENKSAGYDGVLDPTVVGPRPNESIGALHRGKANAVFVDGHVQELTWQDTTNACAGQME